MRKLILTAAVFIGMGTMAFAQKAEKQHKTPEEKAQHATDVLDKKLSLTADQKSKVYALNLAEIKKIKATHVKGEKKDPAVMKAAFDERDSKINSILNDKQRVTYKAFRDKKQQEKKAHKGNHKKGEMPSKA
ncbi:protein CpxP [Pedobacter sp. UYP24]